MTETITFYENKFRAYRLNSGRGFWHEFHTLSGCIQGNFLRSSSLAEYFESKPSNPTAVAYKLIYGRADANWGVDHVPSLQETHPKVMEVLNKYFLELRQFKGGRKEIMNECIADLKKVAKNPRNKLKFVAMPELQDFAPAEPILMTVGGAAHGITSHDLLLNFLPTSAQELTTEEFLYV